MLSILLLLCLVAIDTMLLWALHILSPRRGR